MGTWDSEQKRQWLLSRGFSDDEAANTMAGKPLPMQKSPTATISQAPVKAGAVQPAKGLAINPDSYEVQRAAGQTPDAIADQMAMNSPHFASQLKKIRTKFGNDPSATEAFLKMRFYGDTAYTPPIEQSAKPKGYVGRTLDRIYQRGLGLREDLDAYNRGETTAGQAVTRGSTQIARGILSPVTELSSTVIGGAMEATGLNDAIGSVAQEVAQSDLGQTIAPYARGVADWATNLPEGSGFRDLADIGMAGMDFLDVYGTGQALGVGKRAIVQGATHPLQTIRHPIQSAKTAWSGSPAVAALAPGEKRVLTGTAKQAVSKGMDEKLMTFVAEQNPETRAVMSKMTRAAKEGGEVLGGTVVHKEILGGQIMENVSYILEEKQIIGRALGAMKNAVADDVVDLTDDYIRLMKELRNKGAVLNENGKIISLAGAADDNIPLLQQALDFFQPDDVGRVTRRGKEIDMWRTKMFQEMNSAKAKLQPSSSGQPTFGFAETVTNDMRRASLVKMAQGNNNMIALNDAFEDLSTQTSKFLKAIGYKGKLSPEAITAKELRAGEVSMRTLGNASAETREAFTNIIDTARNYGRVSNIDEMALIRYADALEDLFPITPTRSLQGAVSRATKDSAGNIVTDVGEQVIKKKGFVRGALGYADEKALGVWQKMMGMDPENRYKLLMEVLDAPPDTPFFTVMQEALPDKEVQKIGKKAVAGIDAGDMKNIAQEELAKNPTGGPGAKVVPKKGTPGIDYPAQPQAQKSVNGGSVGGVKTLPKGKTLYHSTDQVFDEFDTSKSADGSVWFTDNKTDITDPNRGVAASGKGVVMERVAPDDLKLATPEMLDEKFADQLIAEGYDGVYYPGDSKTGNWYQIFNPKKLQKLESPKALPRDGATTGIPKELEPLAKEARKYKSAEEFVRAQPRVYHGSQSNLKSFSNKQGTFFTDDYMNADGYASGENVYEGVLNLKKPLIIDAKGRMHNDLISEYGSTTRDVVANVDSTKYDGVVFKNIKDSWIDDADVQDPSTIFYAFRPKDAFLNESQLTDLWKKANNASQ